MGVHHFELTLIPKLFLDHNPDFKKGSWSEEQFDQIEDPNTGCWANAQPTGIILERIRNILPINRSWDSVEEFTSEHEWGSDIRIWKEPNGAVRSITFRYSPAADNSPVLMQFIDIAQSADCMLFEIESRHVIKPEKQQVLLSLKKSSAVRFLSDPIGEITAYSEKIKEERS